MSSRTTESPLSDFDIFNLRVGIFQTAVSFLFFGVYCTLFIVTILIFMTGKLSLSKAQAGSFAVTILALFFSTTSLVLQIITNLPPSSLFQLDPSNRKHYNLIIVLSIMDRLNYLLSDGIVTWRAWILCPSNPLVKLAMCICMILSCAGTFLDTGLTAKKFLRNPENYGAKTSILLMVVPLLVTNLAATSVIVYKMIWHYRNMRKFSTDKTHISALKVQKFLSLLIQSGLVYAIIWTIYTVLTLLNGRESLVFQAFASGMPLISAIYPLFIIIIAASQNQRSNHRQLEGTEAEETGTLGLVSGSAIRQ
ncbi:hypothetical protein K435DRAFT_838736 [Dendrothele bispora CBS 962.96]|uniref:G-protein coupled receptors family 1 profile domain-containing protein n=1 Tax=Dendrothele bispora (strain CBS 962.96) TaxID=1314807 RepID=A0A4S8M588_DENBC|nr:hypothetical protein K435DRAFT_838736 [Dendrothele bispora CBS 962.96]